MAKGVRFVANQRGIDELKTSAGVRADMVSRGERVLDAAWANAPVASGEYRDSLHLEEQPDGSVRVAGGTDHDIYVEADTGNLARALDSA